MPNSDYRVIYKNPESSTGGICIVSPSDNCGLTIEEVAKQTVPTGVKYKIVPVTDVSSDRSFRDAWTVDEANLTDGVGS